MTITDTTPALCAYQHHTTPTTTTHGLLCDWCWQRINRDLADAPQLINHLRTIGQPGATTKPLTTDPAHHGDPAENDPYPQAWHAADELHGHLASWALLIAEERNLTGPIVRLTHGRHDTDQATGEQYTSDPQPAPHLGDTGALIAWMLSHLAWAAEQEWATELRTEIGSTMATLKARWPQAETRTRPVADVPCPRCDTLTLTYSPPSWFKAPFVVACGNPKCGRIFTEDEWAELVFHVTRKSA